MLVAPVTALHRRSHEHLTRSTTTVVTIVIHVKSSHVRHALVSAVIMQRTARVQACEEGHWGWHVNGSKYQGGLGWLHATWLAYRSPHFPLNMADATPQQQAWAMAHFVAHVLHGWWPDQTGCTGGY